MSCRIYMHDAHKKACLGPTHRLSCLRSRCFLLWCVPVLCPAHQSCRYIPSRFHSHLARCVLPLQALLLVHHQCAFALLPGFLPAGRKSGTLWDQKCARHAYRIRCRHITHAVVIPCHRLSVPCSIRTRQAYSVPQCFATD